jgi:hypothetical protein
VNHDGDQLPVRDDTTFQRRVWLGERLGWVVLSVLIIAGLFGVFSNGLASSATVTSPDGSLRVTYERFERKTARGHFTIRIAHADAQEMRVRLSQAFVETHVIESLYPTPLRSSAGERGLELTFAPTAEGDVSIYLAARAQRFGVLSTTVEVEGGARVALWQLIYP